MRFDIRKLRQKYSYTPFLARVFPLFVIVDFWDDWMELAGTTRGAGASLILLRKVYAEKELYEELDVLQTKASRFANNFNI